MSRNSQTKGNFVQTHPEKLSEIESYFLAVLF